MLTLEKAKELHDSQVTEDHLILHAKNVMYAMGTMAEHFGEDREHWMAVGYLHYYDYENTPTNTSCIRSSRCSKQAFPPRTCAPS